MLEQPRKHSAEATFNVSQYVDAAFLERRQTNFTVKSGPTLRGPRPPHRSIPSQNSSSAITTFHIAWIEAIPS